MRRRTVRYLLVCSALIIAGCSDAIAPTRSLSESDAPTISALGSASAVAADRNDQNNNDNNNETRVAHGNGATHISFELRPRGGRVQIGAYTVTYPANSVCDPATSGYGSGTWALPCETLTKSITIDGRVWVENGQTFVDFTPDVRFSPDKEVRISTRVKSLAGLLLTDDLKATFAIYTATRSGTDLILDDDVSPLATVFDVRDGRLTGVISRRVFHFSGYYVRSGDLCDETDLACGGLF